MTTMIRYVTLSLLIFSCCIGPLLASKLAPTENNMCPESWWVDGYNYVEKETSKPAKRRCIVLDVFKKVIVKKFPAPLPCSPLVACRLYEYSVAVELLDPTLRFTAVKFPEQTKLIEKSDNKLRWKISEMVTDQPFNGQYQLTVCVRGNIGSRPTLKILKPAVNIGISGTAPCYVDE